MNDAAAGGQSGTILLYGVELICLSVKYVHFLRMTEPNSPGQLVCVQLSKSKATSLYVYGRRLHNH